MQYLSCSFHHPDEHTTTSTTPYIILIEDLNDDQFASLSVEDNLYADRSSGQSAVVVLPTFSSFCCELRVTHRRRGSEGGTDPSSLSSSIRSVNEGRGLCFPPVLAFSSKHSSSTHGSIAALQEVSPMGISLERNDISHPSDAPRLLPPCEQYPHWTHRPPVSSTHPACPVCRQEQKNHQDILQKPRKERQKQARTVHLFRQAPDARTQLNSRRKLLLLGMTETSHTPSALLASLYPLSEKFSLSESFPYRKLWDARAGHSYEPTKPKRKRWKQQRQPAGYRFSQLQVLTSNWWGRAFSGWDRRPLRSR